MSICHFRRNEVFLREDGFIEWKYAALRETWYCILNRCSPSICVSEQLPDFQLCDHTPWMGTQPCIGALVIEGIRSLEEGCFLCVQLLGRVSSSTFIARALLIT